MNCRIKYPVVVVHGVGSGDAKTRTGYSTRLVDLVLKDFSREEKASYWLEAPWEGVNDNIDAAIKKILCDICSEAENVNGKRLVTHVSSLWAKSKLFCGRLALMLVRNVLPSLLDILLDLPLYIDASRSNKIRNAVIKRIKEVPNCVLVGHSLGSVICHDILSEATRNNTSLPVRALVTFGSPLQWIDEIRQAEDQTHRPEPIEIPWTNLFYRSDPICRYRALDPSSFPGVTNIELKPPKGMAGIRGSFKSHTAYWSDEVVAEYIQQYCLVPQNDTHVV